MIKMALRAPSVALLLTFCCFTFAHAQITTGTAAGSAALFADLLAKPSAAGTMGITEGIIASNSGNVGVTTSGGRLNVPTTANATISKAAIGSAAVKLVRAGSAIGAAYTTYEVYQWAKQSGIATCPPPDFFCKPAGVPESSTSSVYKWVNTVNGKSADSPQAAAELAMPAFPPAACLTSVQPLNATRWYMYVQMTCGSGAPGGYTIDRMATCAAGATLQNGVCVSTAQGGPYTDLELQSGLIGTGGNWDPARGKALYDAVRNDSAKQPGVLAAADLLPPASPATVTAPPLVGPNAVKSTETIQNADGSTSTRTTREQQTITPTTKAPSNGQPATASNPPSVSYPVTTVTTVTTVNNTTNVTNTSTTTSQTNGEADEDKSTLCKLFPDIVACAKLGTAPEAEKLVPLDVTPPMSTVVFASAASCPAGIPYSLGKFGTHQLEFTALCDWLAMVRPIMLAIGACAVAFIYIRGAQTL